MATGEPEALVVDDVSRLMLPVIAAMGVTGESALGHCTNAISTREIPSRTESTAPESSAGTGVVK